MTHVAWPDAAWIREIGMQIIHPGQVVQPHGQVITPAEPRWEIITTIYGWTAADLRTFLNALGGAINTTQIPISQETTVGKVTLSARPVTSVALTEDRDQVELGVLTPATYGLRAGQLWGVGTAAQKGVYEVVSVSANQVNVVPGRLPPSGANTMTPATGIRARLADPQSATWGRYDALTGVHLGTSLRWFEA